MDIEKLVKMSNAVYLVCEEPVADDISDGFKWAINRIKELEGALRKIQQKTGAITIHTDGVDIEEIWTIATKSLEGK